MPGSIDIRRKSPALVAGGTRLATIAVRLADLLVRPDRYHAMRQALARPIFARFRARQPQLPLKYLNRLHLAIGLTSAERAALMIHHYDFLATSMPASALDAIVDRGECLWTCDDDAGCHRVDLVFSHPTDNEGELTLNYTLDGAILSVCSFSFAAGSLVAASDATIIVVTRIQGIRDDRERLRTAMRALGGLSPAMVFLAVLTGIADRFGMLTIAGVAAAAQPARDALGEHAGIATYDAFFESVGGVRISPIFYRIALPRIEKPLSEVKSSNRARTRVQRERRVEIARAARVALGG